MYLHKVLSLLPLSNAMQQMKLPCTVHTKAAKKQKKDDFTDWAIYTKVWYSL